MNNQPNWLDIEQQLYPEIYLSKIIHIESQSLGKKIAQPISYPTEVVYNSLHREINLTDILNNMIQNFFNAQTNYNVLLYDSQFDRFKSVGNYPFKEPVILKGIFVQNQHLIVKVESLIIQQTNITKAKNKTEKTLKYVLQKVAQWRKIYVQSQKKVTLQQAANMIGISRNTLDDYYFQIKLAQKYGFNFQENLQEPFQNLRKYVKQNEQKKLKSNTLPNILSKYQAK